NGGPIEAQAFLEDIRGELVGRDREVLHEPREVTEANVDNGDVLVREHADDVCRTAFGHVLASCFAPQWLRKVPGGSPPRRARVLTGCEKRRGPAKRLRR